MNVLLRISILVCAVLGTGCATSMKYQTGVVPVKPGFELVDQREAEQKEPKILSLLPSGCESGVHRLGDLQILPDRLVVLSTGLETRLGPVLAGKKVELTQFEILNNSHSAGKKTPRKPQFVYVNGMTILVDPTPLCTAPYLLVENPDNMPSIIVTLELKIDGVSYKQRSVQLEPESDATEVYIDAPSYVERLKRGLDAAIQGIAAQIAPQAGAVSTLTPGR